MASIRGLLTLTRADLLRELIAANPDLPPEVVTHALRTILATIVASLAHGDRVELRGFGVFSTVARRAREGHNPRSGAPLTVEAKIAIRFKPSQLMAMRFNPR